MDEAQPKPASNQAGSASANLSQKTQQQATQIAQLQSQLQQAQAALREWVGTFEEEQRGGIFSGVVGQIHPLTVLNELRRAATSEQAAREELSALRPREAALQAALCAKTLENLDLRRQLQAAKQASDPSVVQLRQVLLDPAVNREFSRLRAEAEAKARELKIAQEELQAVQFSQESKAGRMLMAKCRALQDENEEMGRELSEGRLTQLERSLVAAREQLEELRRVYSELEDHAHAMDDEADLLQGQVLSLKRQLAQYQAQQQQAQQQDGGTQGTGEPLPPPPDRPFVPRGRGMGGFTGRGRGFVPRGGAGGGGGFFQGRGGGGAGFESRKRMRDY
ncbi:hypothetical protein N2152v2_000641 [Parachlorella kessleri]